MKSIVLVSQMVDRFANMIKKYAQMTSGDNPKTVVVDALMGNPSDEDSDGKDENSFQESLNKKFSDENFAAAFANVKGDIYIGGRVDVPNDVAELIVTFKEKNPEPVKLSVKNAISQAFKDHFGDDPLTRMKKRKQKKQARTPQGLNAQKWLQSKAEHKEILAPIQLG